MKETWCLHLPLVLFNKWLQNSPQGEPDLGLCKPYVQSPSFAFQAVCTRGTSSAREMPPSKASAHLGKYLLNIPLQLLCPLGHCLRDWNQFCLNCHQLGFLQGMEKTERHGEKGRWWCVRLLRLVENVKKHWPHVWKVPEVEIVGYNWSDSMRKCLEHTAEKQNFVSLWSYDGSHCGKSICQM